MIGLAHALCYNVSYCSFFTSGNDVREGGEYLFVTLLRYQTQITVKCFMMVVGNPRFIIVVVVILLIGINDVLTSLTDSRNSSKQNFIAVCK